MQADTDSTVPHNDLLGTLPRGTRLRNYELVSVLGHGAFGITYRARDTLLGREVAIKEYLPTALAVRGHGATVLPRSSEDGDNFKWGRERFLEEARTLVTLESAPAVVRVYDFLEANGTAYMVMALVRGETLEQRVKREGALAGPIVERLAHKLLDGLEQVHMSRFLHRDIKPANIIVDSNDDPTLIDFGASRASIADRTSAMTAVFTPRYAAIEQLTSDEQGPWTDIYGLAVTLYFAIMGQPPPTALERVLNESYVPLVRVQPAGFRAGLLHGIDAGLAVRPADRPQSIEAWRALFADEPADERAGDTTIVARPPRRAPPRVTAPSSPAPDDVGSAPMARMPRASAGRRRVALLGGGLTAIVVLMAGYFWLSPQGGADGKRQSGEVLAAAQGEDEAAQRAAAEARLRADAEARQQAEAEARQKAEAEARQKAEADAKRQAEVEAARQQAEAETKRQADADAARQQAEAEARRKADAEAQQRADAEAKQRAQAEIKQKADAAAKQKADAAAAQKEAQVSEAALNLSAADRQRLQAALTALGFDTQGTDGTFGPRSRDMIASWQRVHNQPSTGYLSVAQKDSILNEASVVAPPKPSSPTPETNGVKRTQQTPPSLLANDPRCKSILQSAQLTGALADADRAYLRDHCR
jgi:hypothetical protein